MTKRTIVADAPSGRREQQILCTAAALSAAALVAAVVGLLTDHHAITGAPAWLKPAKFAVSISLYCATVAWLLGFVRDRPLLTRVIAYVTGGALLAELALIDLQVLRGTSSHFNTASPFDAAVFSIMGGLVALVFAAAVVLTVVLVRQPGMPPLVRAGIVAGLTVSLTGMLEAVLMIVHGGHTIGAPDADAGATMWVTGWSLDHGDLRVAHFAGLHALQILPALAWLLHRAATRKGADGRSAALRQARSTCVVLVLAVYYAGLVALLTWQAELGRPLAHPGPVIGSAALSWTLVAIATTALCGHTRPNFDSVGAQDLTPNASETKGNSAGGDKAPPGWSPARSVDSPPISTRH